MNSKASLNLSIQAIVIVVIAFVVLGLGLGFVRSQFSSIESTSTSVQEQISQQILDDLRTGNKPLSFPASKLVLETGEESVQAIGIKNTGDEDRSMLIKFFVKAEDGEKEFTSSQELDFTSTDGAEVSSTILWDNEPQDLNAGQTKVVPVTIAAPDKKGNYLFKVKLVKLVTAEDPDEEEYASKTFFIKTS
ncbi:hypothetical protein HOI26_01870 [Candidatus Woesearchaeota archaeon]|nr:hypothetical protein [Candidatus Woesearchaeota archaeon]MBT5739824.1 hypothetical protein [Candidatus Woesearchaeota archaeon]